MPSLVIRVLTVKFLIDCCVNNVLIQIINTNSEDVKKNVRGSWLPGGCHPAGCVQPLGDIG